MKIYPSLISADILNLQKAIDLTAPHSDGYHIDVMDDHFVPNLTWGPAFVNAIIKATSLPIHLHLMVDNPTKWLDRVAFRKNDVFIFHHEAMNGDVSILKKISCKKGVAISPDTSIEAIFPYFSQLDYVLIMSVYPGFSGQAFIPKVVEKVKPLREFCAQNRISATVGIDGEVSASNIKMLSDAGIDEVGVASAIFGSGDPVREMKQLRALCE
jgi:ribulose-phosphate 3-epimerase